jgi:hypothetical protein
MTPDTDVPLVLDDQIAPSVFLTQVLGFAPWPHDAAAVLH